MSQLLAHLFGDYILQSDWMAQNKTKAHWPALVHALLYSLCFVPLCWVATVYSYSWESFDGFYFERLHGQAHHFHWLALLVIFSTHFLIDRFRLARYVVWAKNWLGAVDAGCIRLQCSRFLPGPYFARMQIRMGNTRQTERDSSSNLEARSVRIQ